MKVKSEPKIIHLPPKRWKEYRDMYFEELKNESSAFLYSYKEVSKFKNSYWVDILKKRSKDIYFAEVEGKIIGMSGLSYGAAPKNNHVVSLWGVYVRSSFRQKGIGHLLINNILDDLKKNTKIIKVTLGVVETQVEAQYLYKSLGFKTVGAQKKERFVNGKYLDLFTLEKFLVDPKK